MSQCRVPVPGSVHQPLVNGGRISDQVSILHEGEELDCVEQKVGIRKIEADISPDPHDPGNQPGDSTHPRDGLSRVARTKWKILH